MWVQATRKLFTQNKFYTKKLHLRSFGNSNYYYNRAMAAAVYQRACCVHGCHVYDGIWEVAIGEVLICEREPQNTADRYVVAVKRSGSVIGHLPKKMSHFCSLFLRRGEIFTAH